MSKSLPPPESKGIPFWRLALYVAVFFAAIVIAVLALASCSYLTSDEYPADNVLEELGEEIIDQYTGIDIDLSPSSPER